MRRNRRRENRRRVKEECAQRRKIDLLRFLRAEVGAAVAVAVAVAAAIKKLTRPNA
jgi:hypothetical protein